jgi:hypothetical protein
MEENSIDTKKRPPRICDQDRQRLLQIINNEDNGTIKEELEKNSQGKTHDRHRYIQIVVQVTVA